MASTIKVDNVQNQPGTNIVSKCGTTITLGQSGDTISLASGASQSGFGRTGTVDWQTGSIKTATFTATNGEGYFCNTSGGAFEVDLPAGAAGSIVSVQDYTNNFGTNKLTIDPNGSEKINGGQDGEPVFLNTDGEGVTFVYVDSTVGWRSVQDNQFADKGSAYVIACGGTESTCGDYKLHKFTSPGTFTVSVAASCAANNVVDYLVVAGGGGGGNCRGGGGGAGGSRYFANPTSSPQSASPALPLNGYGSPTPSGTAITVSAQAYPITVGGGGGGATNPTSVGTSGSTAIFSTVTSAGGGGGSSDTYGNSNPAANGGSGGGGANSGNGGSGNTPSVTPAQGTDGGDAPGGSGAGGGGGSDGAGDNAASPTVAGTGGNGMGFGPTAIWGTIGVPCGAFRYISGGGGGGGGPQSPCASSAAGNGGGGAGKGSPMSAGDNGTDNTGGGGGGGADSNQNGGTGGSGIVIIKYKYQ